MLTGSKDWKFNLKYDKHYNHFIYEFPVNINIQNFDKNFCYIYKFNGLF